jgi:hypothetical protein
MRIQKDLYDYYLEQGIAYEGEVEGVGYAYREFRTLEFSTNEKETEFFSIVYSDNMLIETPDAEAVKYIDEGGNKVIEKNVVVLLRQKRTIPINATANQIRNINKQNTRIDRRNNARIEDVKEKLSESFSNAKNTKGESVIFKFNVIGVEISDPRMTSVTQANVLANKYGLPAKDTTQRIGHKAFENAMAAVISEAGAGGSVGEAIGMLIRMNQTNDPLALAHEIGHTLGLSHPNLGADSGLMHYPPQNLLPSEVDEIWDEAYEAK